MGLEQIIAKISAELPMDVKGYSIVRNKKRGQSDTFNILDAEKNPIYIAKFFDYLAEVKGDIGQENIKKYSSLDKLLDNLDYLEDLQLEVEAIVSYVTFQQRCFKRYIDVCSNDNLDCFPELIYSIEEVSTEDSFYGFLVEKYVDGVTLEKKLPFKGEQNKGLLVFSFLMQLASVIKEMSDNGVIHRDISPDNIICLEERYIVIDPGVVKIEDDSPTTQSMMILGKRFYASPEQYSGNARLATFQSDLYAVGIIALEMVIGYNPLRKIIENGEFGSPHDDLLKKYDREIADVFYDNVQDNEFNSRLLLVIKKLVQTNKRYRFDSIDSFIVALTSLGKRAE